MPHLAVITIGADRPGIIARVTGVLFEHGGNLEDSTMTVLGGHFAIMLLVDTESEPEALETAITEATGDMGLVVSVRRVGEADAPPPPTHVLSVYGSDRPGIVHAVTTVLAVRHVNVTDLATHVLEGDRPVYAMVLEVSLPVDLDQDDLVAAVRAEVAQVEVSIHPLDVETF